uniref:beta-N-acetylhexosaminidase n=1 Tax=Parascaris equorum TaxID=6256 RepID=A0A914RLY1_PAREQ
MLMTSLLMVHNVHENNDFQVAHYDNIIVHFDLKGAPPKVAYLKQVLELIKHNGATGILIEWEDTFPFTGIFEDIRASNGYTMAEVKEMLSHAQKLELDIIPLVQTFGHLEWILKVAKFRKYRQSDMYPQVICLADEEAVGLVTEAIRQVSDVHKQFGVKYFHVGADEAFEYGNCEKDIVFISQQKKNDKERLGAQHLAKIAKYVRSLLPTTRVLAWYDMLKTFSQEVITEHKLGDLIEPVVWDYSETVQQQNGQLTTFLLLSFFFPSFPSSSFSIYTYRRTFVKRRI